MKASDIYQFLNGFAPFDTQMDWDNAGLLIGDKNAEITRVGVCLDITADVAKQVAAKGVNLIVSHHPVIFTSVKKVMAGSAVYELVRQGITAICAHTNLDLAVGGVNDTLAEKLGLRDVRPLEDEGLPLGRVGKLDKAYTACELAEKVKNDLGCGGVRFTETDAPIDTVAVCGGAGADLLGAALAAGAGALITGEAKHHELLMAKEMGVSLIDGGHFCTEHGVVYTLKEKLSEAFPALEVVVFDEAEPANYL